MFSPFDLHRPFYTQRPFASTGIAPLPRYYGLIRLLLSLSLHAVLPSSLAELSGHATLLCPAAFPPPKSIRRLHVGFMLTRHWPRGIVVTRLYEKGSLALSLIRSSGETRAHRSRTRLRVLRIAFGEVPSERLSPFCGASLHGLLGPSGYPLASLGPHCVRRVCPNRTSISLRCSSFRY